MLISFVKCCYLIFSQYFASLVWLHAWPRPLKSSGTAKFWNVIIKERIIKESVQHYSVLQSTTPVITCLYYKVLLQYYSVLMVATPVLLCTTKYWSVLLYYKVLLKCYSVITNYKVLHTAPALQSATSVCTTKYYSSTTLY